MGRDVLEGFVLQEIYAVTRGVATFQLRTGHKERATAHTHAASVFAAQHDIDMRSQVLAELCRRKKRGLGHGNNEELASC